LVAPNQLLVDEVLGLLLSYAFYLGPHLCKVDVPLLLTSGKFLGLLELLLQLLLLFEVHLHLLLGQSHLGLDLVLLAQGDHLDAAAALAVVDSGDPVRNVEQSIVVVDHHLL